MSTLKQSLGQARFRAVAYWRDSDIGDLFGHEWPLRLSKNSLNSLIANDHDNVLLFRDTHITEQSQERFLRYESKYKRVSYFEGNNNALFTSLVGDRNLLRIQVEGAIESDYILNDVICAIRQHKQSLVNENNKHKGLHSSMRKGPGARTPPTRITSVVSGGRSSKR